MTAPTINGTRYPQPVDELLPAARDMPLRPGEPLAPSRNRLMRQFRIGAPKADMLRDLLIRERVERDLADVEQADVVDPVGPDRVQGDADSVLETLDPTAGEPVSDPWEHADPAGPDPVVPSDVPGSAPAPAAVSAGPPAAPAGGPLPEVAGAGHPGTPITTRRVPESGAAALPQWKRIRWAVRAVLALGVAASIVGNVLHAQDNLISQAISAWSPLALLLTIELISKVPVHSRALGFARWAATAVIAGIAAWVSYWHMAAVAARYGETGASPYLLPLSVDGLVVVASVCLVELGGRIAAATVAARAAR